MEVNKSKKILINYNNINISLRTKYKVTNKIERNTDL